MVDTPNLGLSKPPWETPRYDLILNSNFDILDGKIQDLTAINKIIASSTNLVDVFIYDTSLDSDGGTWRDRCQNLSWYNEELNTPTRGKTRKFPAIALVLAETNKVTIYDLTDSSTPMWRIHDFSGYTITAVEMLNSKLCVATTTGLYTFDYLSEKEFWYTNSSTPAIINNYVNDVAMIVLPNTEIDLETGLPVPTIAVVTDGGVSVIDGPAGVGTVVNSGSTSGYSRISFGNNYDLLQQYKSSGNVIIASKDNYSTTPFGYRVIYTPSTIPAKLGLGAGGVSPNAIGSLSGLTFLNENPILPAEGMVNYITDSYISGWMQGDIELSISGENLIDKSVASTVITDNGTAIFQEVATNSDLRAVIATGGTITAPVTSGNICYGWELINSIWSFRSNINEFIGISESGGILTIVDGTIFTLLRYTKGVPSFTQLIDIQKEEKELFESDAKYLLPSNNVTSLSEDKAGGIITVGTIAGAVKYKGLRKLSDVLLLNGQTSLNIKAVSSSGGISGIVTAAESGVIIPGINLREEINGIVSESEIQEMISEGEPLGALFGIMQNIPDTDVYTLSAVPQNMTGFTVEESAGIDVTGSTGIMVIPQTGWYRLTVSVTVTVSPASPAQEHNVAFELYRTNNTPVVVAFTTLTLPSDSSPVTGSRSSTVPFQATKGDIVVTRVKSDDSTEDLAFDATSFDIESISISL